MCTKRLFLQYTYFLYDITHQYIFNIFSVSAFIHRATWPHSNSFFLFSSTTMELTSWDLSMCIFGFVSCSFEDISLDKVIPAIAYYHINIPGCFLTYFPTTNYGFDYPNDLCVHNAFLTQIRPYRNITD